MNERKRIWRIVYALFFIGLLSIFVIGIGQLLLYFKSDKEINLLGEELAVLDNSYMDAFWDVGSSNFSLTDKEQLKVGRDMTEAFQALSRATRTNQADGLQDFFTEELTDNMTTWIHNNKSMSITDQQVFLNHKWTIKYINKDRTFINVIDNECVSYHNIIRDNQIESSYVDTCQYDIILIWDQARWNIRHLTREPIAKTEMTHATKIEPPLINVGINYIQPENPWLGFTEHIAKGDYDQQLKDVNKLGVNTIRIFVNYHDYGKEYVPAKMLEDLDDFLTDCYRHDIHVVVTLFDFYGDYRIHDWPYTIAHAQQVVTRLKDNPAIIAWDIKNEPDLDFAHREEKAVVAWLSYMTDYIKSIDSLHVVTIGWSSADHAELLADKLDVLSFHYYDDPSQLASKIDDIDSSLPIWITEIGTPSYNGLWNLVGGSYDQVEYLSQVIEVTKNKNVQPFFWTLYDFEEIPTSVFGRKPWIRANQKSFGLLNNTGQLKPSGQLIIEQYQQLDTSQ